MFTLNFDGANDSEIFKSTLSSLPVTSASPYDLFGGTFANDFSTSATAGSSTSPASTSSAAQHQMQSINPQLVGTPAPSSQDLDSDEEKEGRDDDEDEEEEEGFDADFDEEDGEDGDEYDIDEEGGDEDGDKDENSMALDGQKSTSTYLSYNKPHITL